MRSRTAALAVLSFVAALAACSRQPAPASADDVLKRMSQKLADAPRMGFTVRREIDPELIEGRDLKALTTIEVRLVRPNRIALRSDSGDDRRAMFSDGTTFTLQDVTKNIYSTIQLASTLDTLDEQLQKVYGFVPPLLEFVSNKPYEHIQSRVTAVTYAGEGKDASGAACHRLALAGEVVDAELCVGVADNHPRQLIGTFRSRATQPKFRLYFSAWDLSPAWADSELAFTAPAGAMKIPMRTVAEMQELVAAGAKKGKGK
jgi:hypothetical protein